MKAFFLLTTTFCLCCTFLHAQNGTVFHNQGDVYCYGTDSSTVMYVQGHMKVSTGEEKTSAIKVEKSRVMLTGDFYNDVTKGATGGQAFVSPTGGTEGFIEFCGDSAQYITSTLRTFDSIPSKTDNYINFPNIDINNSKHVTLSPRLAAKTKNIELTKGWLILDSDIAHVGIDGDETEVDEKQQSVLAHLFVDGNVNYNQSSWSEKTDANERGFIQVNLKIPAEPMDSIAKSIVGLGIPFKTMYSDYFAFNTIFAPTDSRFLEAPIVDPKTELIAGKGYVVGIDLRGAIKDRYPNLDGYPNADFDRRATNGYEFNRHEYFLNGNPNQVFTGDVDQAAYKNETLNTADVVVPLTKGYNFLSNPFTCPLNINSLLSENILIENGGSSDWGDGTLDIYNQVWILNPGSIAEVMEESYTNSRYTYNYLVARETGGTYLDEGNGYTAIAPLQMFVVYSYENTNMIIPGKERIMGNTRFLRNATTANHRRDDFIIEFRDQITKTNDRANIVLRSSEELKENPSYTNVVRMSNTPVETAYETRSAASAFNTTDGFIQNLSSQIYTKDESGQPLTVQFLPFETTKKVTLYHIPSSLPQPIQILGLRLKTKDRVDSMWLLDGKEGVEVEITPDMVYETHSEPDDSPERFSIRFGAATTGIDDNVVGETGYIYAYTNESNIIVEGFKSADMGNKIELYNINGSLLSQRIINGPSVNLGSNISGVYFVKINKEAPETIKVIIR